MKEKLIFIIMAFLSALTLFGQRQYNIGDLYDVDGIKGIVFSVEDDGRHGKIVALENSGERVLWGNPVYFDSSGPNHNRATPTCYYKGDKDYTYEGVTTQMVAKAFSGATDKNDGAYNCDKIVDNFISDEGSTATLYCHPLSDMVWSYIVWPRKLPKVDGGVIGSHFKKFEMAEKLPSYKYNWYIPAINELKDLYGACAQDGLNEKIMNAGGKPLKGWFWSSTEVEHYSQDLDIEYSDSAWVYDMTEGYEFGWRKNEDAMRVRLIRRF